MYRAIHFPIKWSAVMCRRCGRVKKNPCGMERCPLFGWKELVEISGKEAKKMSDIGIDIYAIARR